MLTYAEAVDHLYGLGQELAAPRTTGTPRRKFDLEHMRILSGALGNPEGSFPAVLIGGTNGKGSTAATLASILTASGFRTALYTSPHLYRVNERIRVDGSAIPDDDFARLYARVCDAAAILVAEGRLPFSPSFFEVLTAQAFLYFAQQEVEIAVLEVGLGGRLDATNIVEPILSVITDISLDHQEYLGSTITAITREKVGILRAGGTLVTLPQHPEANQAIGEAAAGLNLRAISAARFVPTPESFQLGFGGDNPISRNRYSVSLDGELLQVDSPLCGRHQQRNLALAIATASELGSRMQEGNKMGRVPRLRATVSNRKEHNISIASIESGIRSTQWPGRLEFVAPDLLLDVAHNPAGAWSLRAALNQLPEGRPRTLIFSCLADKDLQEMTRILFPLFDATSTDSARAKDHIVLAPIVNARAAALGDLLEAARRLDIPAHVAPHVHGALAQARELTSPGGLIVATGSIYLVGEIRHLALRG